MKTNIVLVSLLDDLNKEVSIKIAKDFDLYLADMSEILEYNLMNAEEIKTVCGEDYLNSLKNKAIKDVATYENTLISISYGLFVDKDNIEVLKKYGTIVYLKFTKEAIKDHYKSLTNKEDLLDAELKLDMYKERNAMCEQYSDLVIELSKDDYDFCCKKIKKVLDKYYL